MWVSSTFIHRWQIVIFFIFKAHLLLLSHERGGAKYGFLDRVYHKTAPNEQNDLKFYMQGAFARLQLHKKVMVSFGTIFKVRITPNDTVTFLCDCILDFGQVEVTQHLWRSNQYVSLLAPSECQTCILNTQIRLSSRFDQT